VEDTNNKCCSEGDDVDVDNNENDDFDDDADAAIPKCRRVRMTDRTLLLFVINFLI
jgi:hypothetical protein